MDKAEANCCDADEFPDSPFSISGGIQWADNPCNNRIGRGRFQRDKTASAQLGTVSYSVRGHVESTEYGDSSVPYVEPSPVDQGLNQEFFEGIDSHYVDEPLISKRDKERDEVRGRRPTKAQ